VYLPVFFALRRRGDLSAKLYALVVVFVTSALLHYWSNAWSTDFESWSWPNEWLFWLIFCGPALIDLWLEHRAEARRAAERRAGVKPSPGRLARAWAIARRVVQIALMLGFVSSLWLLEQTASVKDWFDIMTSWR
jgi:hypothetical protein